MGKVGVPVLPVGEVGQEKDGGSRADFFPPAASGAGTVWCHTFGFG